MNFDDQTCSYCMVLFFVFQGIYDVYNVHTVYLQFCKQCGVSIPLAAMTYRNLEIVRILLWI